MEDSKKCSHMENVFQFINRKYISLNEDQKKVNNVILKQFIEELITKMKDISGLFKSLYETMFYGGSYYDGLKISKPEEYDCDLLLKIPKYSKPKVITADRPGFVQIQLTELEKFKKQPEFNTFYSDMEKYLLDSKNYVRVDKLKKWMESVFQKAFNTYPENGAYRSICVDDKIYYFKKSKGGPAFTIHLSDSTSDEKFFMDIDLVPCFKFDDAHWPDKENFRKNPSELIRTFFAVPKKPAKISTTTEIDRCWRLSFQEQEKEIMEERQSLKPALKLLKKLRDTYNHASISSYFIKTIFLWEIEKSDNSFWKQNLSVVFIEMLKKFTGYLEQKSIPYYWDSGFNLIGDVKDIELDNIKNKYKRILSDIEQNITDPYIGAKYLVPKEDWLTLKETVPIGKKYEKKGFDCLDGGIFLNIGTTSFSRSNSAYSAGDKSNIMESILKEVQEVNSKVDNLVKEQKNTQELLQHVSEKQIEFQNQLHDHQILINKQINSLDSQ